MPESFFEMGRGYVEGYQELQRQQMGMTHENNGPMVLRESAPLAVSAVRKQGFEKPPVRYAFNFARNLSQFTGCTYSKSTSSERASSPSLSLMYTT